MDRLIIQGTPEEVAKVVEAMTKAYPNMTLAEVLRELSKEEE